MKRREREGKEREKRKSNREERECKREGKKREKREKGNRELEKKTRGKKEEKTREERKKKKRKRKPHIYSPLTNESGAPVLGIKEKTLASFADFFHMKELLVSAGLLWPRSGRLRSWTLTGRKETLITSAARASQTWASSLWCRKQKSARAKNRQPLWITTRQQTLC